MKHGRAIQIKNFGATNHISRNPFFLEFHYNSMSGSNKGTRYSSFSIITTAQFVRRVSLFDPGIEFLDRILPK